MNKINTLLKSSLTVLFLFFIAAFSSCNKEEDYLKSVLQDKSKLYSNYRFNSGSSILSRVQLPPEFVLNDLNKSENTVYTPYMPSKNEIETIKNSIELLPLSFKEYLQKRVLGIYFINKFQSSGMTDWVYDKGRLYCIMFFNPELLRHDMGAWATKVENTCFIQNNTNISVKIFYGTRHSAFLKLLLHETAHVLDYTARISPFMDDSTYALYQIKNKKLYLPRIKKTVEIVESHYITNKFIDTVWLKFDKPYSNDDFYLRDKISFYGFKKGPLIKISDALNIYSGLSNKPFTSLYGAQLWVEDFAEYVANYYIVKRLNIKYGISIISNHSVIFYYEPMKNSAVLSRAPFILDYFDHFNISE